VLLARDARPGDAVALDPPWAERAREVLPASLPVLSFPRLAGEDLLGVRRVWLLALVKAPGRRRLLERDLLSRAGSAIESVRLGALELTRFELHSPLVALAFLPDRLDSAKVSAAGQDCARQAIGSFRCPTGQSVGVAREEREVDFLPRPCLRAHPSAPGTSPLTITFPEVPMGRILRGHTGMVGETAPTGRAPTILTVHVDDEEIGAAEEDPRQTGWHTFRLDTPREAGHLATVTFTLSTEDVGPREFCFDAYTLP